MSAREGLRGNAVRILRFHGTAAFDILALMTRSRHQWFVPIALAMAFAAPVVPVNAARAQEQYICELTQVTGFAYNEVSKTWNTARFSNSDRYIISRPLDKWEIKELGRNFSSATCDYFNEHGFLMECVGLEDFMFNKESNRFMVTYRFGYVVPNASQDGDHTPYMGIGTCSPF